MTALTFSIIMVGVAYCAGLLGALTGIGGGIVITPILVLFFHVDIHYAMGASLVAVIVTSSGAAITYLKEGYSNIRIGMLLEVTAVLGAGLGAVLVARLPISIIAVIFGLILIFSAYFSIRRRDDVVSTQPPHPWAVALDLNSSYSTKQGTTVYSVYHVPLAMGLMTIAGCLSSLLGIGAGALKVLAMDQAMRLPYRVSTATSNFIIGITAAAGAGAYLSLGYVNPVLTFPVVIGVLGGAMTGAVFLKHINTRILRLIFGGLVFVAATQMIYKGLIGAL